MIVASRMKWAALTPSRCASCSTRVQRESAKRTVVARIGMGRNLSPTASLPISPRSRLRQRKCRNPGKRYRSDYIRANYDRHADASRRSTREHAAEVHRAAYVDPARRDARRGRRAGGLRAASGAARATTSAAGRSVPTSSCSPAAAPSTSGAARARASGSSSGSRSRPTRCSPGVTARRPRSPAPPSAGSRAPRCGACRRSSARRSASPTGAACRRRSWPTAEGIPLGTAKSRVRLGLAKLSRDPELVAA